MLPVVALQPQLDPLGVADRRTSLSPKFPHLLPVGQLGIHNERSQGLDELTVTEDVDRGTFGHGFESIQSRRRPV